MAKLDGEDVQGTWKLNVIDDSSSAGGGARLVRWSLDVDAMFAGPQSFSGLASDTQGFDCGIASVELRDGSGTVQLLHRRQGTRELKGTRVELVEGRSEVFTAPDRSTTMVLYRGGEIVREISLLLDDSAEIHRLTL